MISVTEGEFLDAMEDNSGWCLACGEDVYGVEPDARKYKCQACGAHEVYGASELLIMGEIWFL